MLTRAARPRLLLVPASSSSDLVASVAGDAAETTFYLCGPPSMIEAVERSCLEAGAAPDRIVYEKWW